MNGMHQLLSVIKKQCKGIHQLDTFVGFLFLFFYVDDFFVSKRSYLWIFNDAYF